MLCYHLEPKPENPGSGDEGGILRNRHGREGRKALLSGPVHTHGVGTGNALLVTIPGADLHWLPARRAPQTLNPVQHQVRNPGLLVGKGVLCLIKKSGSLDLAASTLSSCFGNRY